MIQSRASVEALLRPARSDVAALGQKSVRVLTNRKGEQRLYLATAQWQVRVRQEETMSTLKGPSIHRNEFAAIVGFIATAIAGVIGLVVALSIAAAVVVIGFFGAILLAFASLAMRARRPSRARTSADPEIIEAKRVGGHSWVAYGWDNQQ